MPQHSRRPLSCLVLRPAARGLVFRLRSHSRVWRAFREIISRMAQSTVSPTTFLVSTVWRPQACHNPAFWQLHAPVGDHRSLRPLGRNAKHCHTACYDNLCSRAEVSFPQIKKRPRSRFLEAGSSMSARPCCMSSPSPGRVGLRIVPFGAVSAFTHVTACRLADGLSPPVDNVLLHIWKTPKAPIDGETQMSPHPLG